MAVRIDPERNEVRALRQAADWGGRRVLEIGCGEGRLTHRLAELGARVQAIDADAGLLRKARRVLPPGLASQVAFRVGRADSLEHRAGTFDRVVYSWAL